jgi:hypothetical protein
MKEATIFFVEGIANRFPSVRELLREHVEDNDEIIPHVFFGDLTRHLTALYKLQTKGDSNAASELRGILDDLENGYVLGDSDIQELIVVSFLENLPAPGEEGAELREMVGPNLKNERPLFG